MYVELHASRLLAKSSMNETPPQSGPAAEAEAETPASADAHHDKRCCKEHRKLCICSVCLAVTIVVLGVLIAIRHATRMRDLDPMLDVIVTSSVCLNAQRNVCQLQLTEDAVESYDLKEVNRPMLGFLYHQVVREEREEMREVLSGAHMVVQDPDGSIYSYLTTLPGAYKRISSHRSDRSQYGVPAGHVLSGLLVGTIDNSTWLQLEGAEWDPLHAPWSSAGHILDFLEYRLVGKNIGPLGTSKATDRQPMMAGSPETTSEACPRSCGSTTHEDRPQAPRQPGALAILQKMVQPAARDGFQQLRGSAFSHSDVPDNLVKLGGGLGGAVAAAGLRVGRSAARSTIRNALSIAL